MIRSLLLVLCLCLAVDSCRSSAFGQGKGLSDLPVDKIGLPPPLDGKEKPYLITDAGGHTAVVKAAFFLPSGENAVTVSQDRTVRLWDIGTGEMLQVYRFPTELGQGGVLYAGDASPDGRWIAVAGLTVGGGKHGDLIYLLSLETSQVATVLKGHTDGIVGLRFSHDSRRLASASIDGTARLYDLQTAKMEHVLRGHKGRVRKVCFSHDDRLIATVGADRTARIWSAADGKSERVLADFPADPLGLAWHPRENLLATGGQDGTISLWNADGTLKQTLVPDPKSKMTIGALDFSPDGDALLYGGIKETGKCGIVNLKDGKLRLAFIKHNNTVHDARFSPDGSRAITTGGDEHETYIWDPADGKVVHKLQGAGKSIFSVAWRKDGRAIAWGNQNQGLPAAPLEHSFLLDDLQFGPAPDRDYRGHVHAFGRWSAKQISFTQVAFSKDGVADHAFNLKEPNRIYSMAILADDRAVLGTAFGPLVLDLTGARPSRLLLGQSDAIYSISPAADGKSFLTGSASQLISVWDPDRNDPLASLFAAGRDWIAWTPAGYYACSAYGERLMGWQVNHGAERLGTFHPAARFRTSLYQPNLVRFVFTEKNFEKALALASQDRAEPIRAVNVAAVLPPQVVLTAPTGAAATVKGAAVDVKAMARSQGDHPITSMRLLVDGRPYQGDKGIKKFDPPAKGEVQAAWTVDLLPGKHAIAAAAESAVSKGISPWVEVTRVDVKADELPNLNLLAVGISAYPGALALRYAHKDATVLEKTLRAGRHGVFRNVDTRLLTDEQATRKNILDGLDWLEKQSQPTDVAVVFLAGHGSRDAKGQFFFIPVDIGEDLEKSAVGGDLLKKKLANLSGRVVIILDACHSGAASRLKRAMTDDLVRDLVSEDAGVVVMCSSQGAEYSLESNQVAHGFYTLGLVEALSGRADFNNDRYIYLHELDFYAYNRVRQLSDGAQNPTTGRPTHLRSFPLAKVKSP
jgi:WD40 repeat protein